MYVEKKKIIFGDWEDVTGNHDQDALICTLRAVEQREGERLGWDRPARLWTVHLVDPDAGVAEVRPVAGEKWKRGMANPSDDLAATAARMPAPGDLTPIPYVETRDSAAAVVFMTEVWGALAENLTDEELAAHNAGRRAIEHRADRIEMRMTVAVDINGHGFSLVRIRGGQLKPPILSTPHQLAEGGQGRVLGALARIAGQLRDGKWPS